MKKNIDKKKSKNMQKRNGITLISLVIIVVILLILAGIAIYVNTSGGSLATNVDKQTKKANEDYLESEAKIIITETYGEKKGTSKETIIDFEKTKVENLKKQYEKRGGKVPETLKVNENGDIIITNGVLVSFKQVTGLNIHEAAALTRD